jgi:hypothetical protein
MGVPVVRYAAGGDQDVDRKIPKKQQFTGVATGALICSNLEVGSSVFGTVFAENNPVRVIIHGQGCFYINGGDTLLIKVTVMDQFLIGYIPCSILVQGDEGYGIIPLLITGDGKCGQNGTTEKLSGESDPRLMVQRFL